MSSSDFKCEQRGDPPGSLYAAAKTYLSKFLAPASFKTFWKLICAFELFVLRAMNPHSLLSAARVAGFDCEGNGTRKIMLHNLEFAQIQPASKAEEVLAIIDTVFTPYWTQHGLIHENIFSEVFDGETSIDTLGDRIGKPLNDMATNRQRFMLDNHPVWKTELERRRLAEEFVDEEIRRRQIKRIAADAAKPVKSRECSVLGCPCLIDITTASIKIRGRMKFLGENVARKVVQLGYVRTTSATCQPARLFVEDFPMLWWLLICSISKIFLFLDILILLVF